MTASDQVLKTASTPSPVFETILLVVLAIPLCVAIAALAWRSTLLAPINYNEGCNAWFVSVVQAGGPLYLPPEALLTNNYPPLSFYLLAPLAALLGDAVFAGRLVAWLAFAAINALIFAIPYRRNGDLLACLFGATIFAGYMVINYDIYVGMNDPQMLAHAIMLCGLFFAVSGNVIAAALLMAAGLFVKHNIIALPIALALWLAIHDRPAAMRFVAAGILVGGIGLACCLLAFGPDFLASLRAARQYVPVRGWRHALEWLAPMQLPVLLGLLGAVLDRDNRTTTLFATYLVVAIVLACLLTGGDGVNFNLMFEVVIAFSLAAGQLLARLRQQRSLRGWAIGAYAFAALINAGLVATQQEILLRPWIAMERARVVATEATVRLLADHPGPALCDTPILCYWAHKQLELDPFNFGQGVIAGTKDEGIVLSRINAGYYGAIELGSELDSGKPSFIGPRLLAAVAARYRKLPGMPGGSTVYVKQ